MVAITVTFRPLLPYSQGSFSVTVELRGLADVNYSHAQHDCEALIDYLIDFGAIDAESRPLPPLLYPATPLAGVEPVATPVGGLLVFTLRPGEYLCAGQLIAEIIDPISDKLTPVYCSSAGLLYARSQRRMATAGMVIANVAGREPTVAAICYRLEAMTGSGHRGRWRLIRVSVGTPGSGSIGCGVSGSGWPGMPPACNWGKASRDHASSPT